MIWRAATVLMITMGLSWAAQAQYQSHLGQFEVDQVSGCAPLPVTVTVIPPYYCNDSNPCAAFWENSINNEPLINPPFTHLYSQPGIYTLKILMGVNMDSIQIEVFPNAPPAFDVYTCSGNEVAVTINDTRYDEYIINYNDGSPEVIMSGAGTTSHVYATSTPQTVTVRGRNLNAADNCSSASKAITPLPTLPMPSITLVEVLDDASIRLEINGQPNIEYKLGIATNNATVFQEVKTMYNVTVDTISGLRTDDNYYCFRLAAFDRCNNNVVVNSATICSANFDLAVRNNAIDLTWLTNAAGSTNFGLTRNASDGTTLVTTPSGSSYADLAVTCGVEYCYRLTTDYPAGSRSISITKCGVGYSTDIPSAIENVTAITGDNSVILEWQTDPDYTPSEFFIEKSIQGNYSFFASTTQPAVSDPAYQVAEASCYKVSYRDLCDNESPPGIEACPIRLAGTLRKDNAISLSWTPYAGWADGVSHYTVEKYSEDGQLLQTFEPGTALTYVDASNDLNFQTFLYVVKATAEDGGLADAVSNTIAILKDPNLFHPTAFTPNGDNLNDIFTVFGQYVVDFEMQIFNRWGELLFTTNNLEEGWNGTFRGDDMPEGTYTFIAHIKDRAGRTFKRSGSVLLLRK